MISVHTSLPTTENKESQPPLMTVVQSDADRLMIARQILYPQPVQVHIDEDFLCPITQSLMRDPVMATDGHTYEREAIETWLSAHDTSPLTNERFESKALVPNVFARGQIEKLLVKVPALRDSKELFMPKSWVQQLKTACASGDKKTIEALAQRDRRLLIHLRDEEKPAKAAIHWAAGGHPKSLEKVIQLLERRQLGLALAALLQPDGNGHLPIHLAVLSGQSAETLLKMAGWMKGHLEGIKIPADWTPVFERSELNKALMQSVLKEDLPALRFFLSLGTDVDMKNDTGDTLLLLAIKHDCNKSMIALLEKKADSNRVNTVGDNAPLHAAVRAGAVDAIAALKKQGARLDLPLNDGTIPLHLAAEQKTLAMANALYGEEKTIPPAQCEAKDADGCTPLHRAVIRNSEKMAEWLLAKGSDIEAVNVNEQTPLHLAARHSANNCLSLLLKKEAALEQRDEKGNTALHLAAQAGNVDGVILLLRAGVLPDIKNQTGQTARQLAKSSGQREVIEVYDKTLAEIRKEEEAELRSQGVLGLLLLKQQKIIFQQSEEIEKLRSELQEQRVENEKLKAIVETQDEKLQRHGTELKEQAENVAKLRNEEVKPLTALHGRFFSPSRERMFAEFFEEKEKKEKAVEEKKKTTVGKLLLHVAEGEQDKAEAMLKHDTMLALSYGKVTDKSERKFSHITGFQYAVWALDWHMWEMMLRQFNSNEHWKLAAAQYQELDSQGTEHGKMFSLDSLIQALQTCSDKYSGWTTEQREEHWCRVVGELQRRLPWHVVNEYCRPDRPFSPCPSFIEQKLMPRGKGREKEWFETGDRHKLGIDMAWWRGRLRDGADKLHYTTLFYYSEHLQTFHIHNDRETLTQMSKTRVLQRKELGQTLKGQICAVNAVWPPVRITLG